MRILVTGAAGFIGFHVAGRLLERGDDVLGVDNLDDYYDVRLKQARLARLQVNARFRFELLDIRDRERIAALFAAQRCDAVLHLAAQAGVRHSIENPYAYIDANLVGFGNVLEGCRRAQAGHLVFASSSSVYGGNVRVPFSEHHSVDHPVSLYAATKKANEVMAHSYAHLYALPCTGLRFFTVYGPWGRPDMALFKFTRAILADEPITVYNHGNMVRDFTYVDDIAEGVVRVIDRVPRADPEWNRHAPDPATSWAPYRVFNIGSSRPEPLRRYIELIERCLGRKAKLEMAGMQPGDVPETFADVGDLAGFAGFRPKISIDEGVPRFVAWYREYHGD